MSRYIAKYMNIEKLKRPIFWNGGRTLFAQQITNSVAHEQDCYGATLGTEGSVCVAHW